MKNINYENLEELGIFEIRNLAREVGVYSPTTLKKQELIEKILRVLNGKDEPYIKKTKQGRPPKNITSMNNLMDVIVPSKLFETKKEMSLNNVFNDYNETLDINDAGSDLTYFKTIIKVYGDNEYALAFLKDIKEEKDNVVFINHSQVKFYNLKSGDEIAGKYASISSDKPFVLKQLYSINEKSFSQDFQREVDFKLMPANFPQQKLKMNIYKEDEQVFKDIDLFVPLAKGQRIVLVAENNNTFLNLEILNRLSTADNNLTGLALLIDEMPENYYEILSNKKIETLSNNYNIKQNLLLELDVKISRLLRRVEEGQDVVLFINDIEKLFSYLQNSYIMLKYSLEESKIKAEEDIKKLILLSKFSKTGGSLTVMIGTQNTLENKCLSYFNNVLYYSKLGFEFVLNKEKSFVLNIEKILTKTELQKYNDLKHN